MQKSSKVILIGAGLVLGAVVIGILAGWFGTREQVKSGPQNPSTADGQLLNTSSPVAWSPPITSTVPAIVVNTTPPPAITTASNSNPQVASANLLTNWEDKVDEILSAEGEDSNKVAQLYAMFPHLPEDGKVEVAQHLSNLVPDSDYAPLGQMLQDTNLSEPVLDVLLADVLNRPNATKLPLLLDVARNPDNSKSAEAKDLLELYLDEDYGKNWAQWQQKMQDWLKENPD